MNNEYMEKIHFVPLLASAALTTSIVFSKGVKMSNYRWCTFLVHLGVCDTIGTITVYESTSAATGSAITMPFYYRLADTVGVDALGASTSCASTGVTYALQGTGTAYVVDVDPATMTDGYTYLRVCITPSGTNSSSIIGVDALLDPKYLGKTPISSV